MNNTFLIIAGFSLMIGLITDPGNWLTQVVFVFFILAAFVSMARDVLVMKKRIKENESSET